MPEQQLKQGFIYALSAFLLWGLAPVFFKLLAEVNAFEVLAHRVVWSVLILALVVQLRRQWRALLALPRSTYKRLFYSSAFVSVNWLVFIWAVAEGRILETSLGYFINPLISVLFGMLFLAERLRPWQVVALILATLGVLNQIVLVGHLPWVALVLALSFAIYGLLRKSVTIDPVLGLFVETLMMLPFALVYLAWLAWHEQLTFGSEGFTLDLTLAASGLMTTIPLLFFAAGAQRLTLTSIGLIQYIAPSMTFCLAIFVYNEAFSPAQLITFALIWTGLVVFSVEGLKQHRNNKRLLQP